MVSDSVSICMLSVVLPTKLFLIRVLITGILVDFMSLLRVVNCDGKN